MRRVLQVGYGNIGRTIFDHYTRRFMVTDPRQHAPAGHEWDGQRIDLVCVVVDTPGLEGRFDYGVLIDAVEEYLALSDFVLIRSTVSLDFLAEPTYRANSDRIGFCPEFYGTTEFSNPDAFDIGFSLFSDNVPDWFVDHVGVEPVLRASPAEVIMAKLADNAFLATKVTFFHELYLACQKHNVDFDVTRVLVTHDPRVVNYHSYCDGDVGWQSHCFDKDVPVYAELTEQDGLVRAMLRTNQAMLDRPRRL